MSMEEILSWTWLIFQLCLMSAGSFCTLLGLLTVFYWVKSPKPPADTSNRINNITVWWIGLTRPHVLAKHYKPLRHDVLDNLEDSKNKDS